MLLKVIKEVGQSGGDYHLAVGKVIEVSEAEAQKLQADWPGCLEEVGKGAKVVAKNHSG